MVFNNYLEDENDKPYFTTNSLAYYYDKMEGFAKAVEGSAKALNLTKEEVEKRLTLYIEQNKNELDQRFTQNKNELDQRLAQWDGKLETFDSSVETLLTEWVDDGTLTPLIDSTLIDQRLAPVAAQLVDTVKKGEPEQISSQMLTQGVRESMTGGSVAVVGTRSVGLGQLYSTMQKDISALTTKSLTMLLSVHYRDVGGVATEFNLANYHSAILPASNGDVFIVSTIVSSINQIGIAYVDDNMNIKGKVLVGTGSPVTHTAVESIVPIGTTQVIFSVNSASGLGLTVKKYEYTPLATKSYVEGLMLTGKWTGKNVIYQGDSITDAIYNGGLSTRWTEVVNSRLGLVQTANYAISGSTLAVNPSSPTERNPIVNRLDAMSANADIIFNAAITNDWFYSWSPIGTMDSREPTTLYGALHLICLHYKKKYPNATIIFTTGIKRNQGTSTSPNSVNALGKTLKEYNDILKEVCRYYSIRVLDMDVESGLFPFDNELALLDYTDQGFFTHPNANGQLKMGRVATGYLNNIQ